MSDKIKVVGYAQKVTYVDGIEYRNFTPDLVGNQLASDEGTPLFTMGNFYITTNMENKLTKTYRTSKFSNFITLSELDLTLEQTKTLLTDNAGVYLNLDKSKLDHYALFGSFTEFVRVSLENIIINWPASLYITPFSQIASFYTVTGYTVENYSYDSLIGEATFRINTNFINNKFQIVYTTNGSIMETYNETNTLRNLTSNYASYAVLFGGEEYPLIAFTASTYNTNDYIYLTVMGDPFSGATTSLNVYYHIKPSKINTDKFFNTLPDFEYYLLSRNVVPAYTAAFKYPIKSDDGLILYVTNKVTWPVSDGYNIEFDTTSYENYANKLLEISNGNDLYSSNLMNRFLVSESITAFDTEPVRLSDLDQDTSGQKVNKTLQVYGREFDEINKFIVGIEFANTVTYNKQDNTPDIYLKNLARVLGWELVSSVLENDLLASYVTTHPSSYTGQTVGLTAVEADVELWRRLILNSPWLWKSKGARKGVEFLLKFIGAPQGLFKFNEYIYKANAPIDVELFRQMLTLNGLSDDISLYPIDPEGYPRPLPDTPDMYFQNDGLWYRETGGSGSTIDILVGNNPHVGPYDGGSKYFEQFECLIPNYSAVTISSETTTTDIQNLYVNYDLGAFNEGVTTATTVNTVQIVSLEGADFDDCVIFTPTIEQDPNPTKVINECGCECDTDDKMLSLCIERGTHLPPEFNCIDDLVGIPTIDEDGIYVFKYKQYNADGSLTSNQSGPIYRSSAFVGKTCCERIRGIPYLYDVVVNNVIMNTGYVCCDGSHRCGCTIACQWVLITNPIALPIGGIVTPNYLQFIKPSGSRAVTTPDGCNCIPNYTTPVPDILDPYTGDIGYGCQLNEAGLADILLGVYGEIYNYYHLRSTGVTSCFGYND